MRVMQAPPERKNGEDGLPIPPYAVYNIGNNQPENLLDFVDILQQELIRAGVLPDICHHDGRFFAQTCVKYKFKRFRNPGGLC